ncbi:MAG: hypothetical protein Q4G40_02185 [Brachybacterium sp.]|nr:hypothetical protein [Brachybacterium sp.]
MILLLQGNRAAEHEASTVLNNLDRIEDDLRAGAIVVFTNDNIRIRTLPISN